MYVYALFFVESKTVYCYFAKDFFQLVNKFFETRIMVSLYKLFRRYKSLEDKFQQLRVYSYIMYV